MKVEIVNIVKKDNVFDKTLSVFKNGHDNQYPERMDRLINNSVTAKTSANIMAQYLLGKGFGAVDNFIVDQQKQTKFIEFADDASNSKVKQKGLFIHVNWNANFNISGIKMLPFTDCRLGKKDDYEYNGKIAYSKDWTKAKSTNIKLFDVFNDDQIIIESQVRKASGNEKKPLSINDWSKYKGQILYVNDENEYTYPTSRFDSVALDCDSEYLASVFKNRTLRRGFFGKMVAVTRPMIDKNISQYINIEGQQSLNPEYQLAVSEKEKFDQVTKSFLGAENADGLLHVQLDWEHEKLDDAIKFVKIDSDFNDKQFAYTEESIRKNILVAANNLPVGLVQASEGIFTQSGSALLEMKQSYWENTTKERNSLTSTFNYLLARFEGYEGGNIEALPLLVSNDLAKQEKIKSQSILNSSVVGVTAILSIQAGVVASTTTLQSGVAMLINIFGYDEQVAKEILGNPKLENGTVIN